MLLADGVVFGNHEAEGCGDALRNPLVRAELDGHLEGERRAGGGLGGFGGVLGAVRSHDVRSFSERRGPLASRRRGPLGAAEKSPALNRACTLDWRAAPAWAAAQRRTAEDGNFVSRGIRPQAEGENCGLEPLPVRLDGLKPRQTGGMRRREARQPDPCALEIKDYQDGAGPPKASARKLTPARLPHGHGADRRRLAGRRRVRPASRRRRPGSSWRSAVALTGPSTKGAGASSCPDPVRSRATGGFPQRPGVTRRPPSRPATW